MLRDYIQSRHIGLGNIRAIELPMIKLETKLPEVIRVATNNYKQLQAFTCERTLVEIFFIQ